MKVQSLICSIVTISGTGDPMSMMPSFSGAARHRCHQRDEVFVCIRRTCPPFTCGIICWRHIQWAWVVISSHKAASSPYTHVENIGSSSLYTEVLL